MKMKQIMQKLFTDQTSSPVNKPEITPETVFMIITPEWAIQKLKEHSQDMVENGFKQRKISSLQIRLYVRDMKNNSWGADPNPIAFDTNGSLINGQHRLIAISRSRKSYYFNVTVNWPIKSDNGVKSMSVIDNGRKRSVGQQLQVTRPIKNGVRLASCLNGVAIMCSRSPELIISAQSSVAMMDSFKLEDAINHIFSLSLRLSQCSSHIVGPLAFMYMKDPEKISEFCVKFFSQELLQAGDPELLLQRWLSSRKRSGNGSHRYTSINGVCLCIKAKFEGRTMSKISYTDLGLEWVLSQNQDLVKKVKGLIDGEQTDLKSNL